MKEVHEKITLISAKEGDENFLMAVFNDVELVRRRWHNDSDDFANISDFGEQLKDALIKRLLED